MRDHTYILVIVLYLPYPHDWLLSRWCEGDESVHFLQHILFILVPVSLVSTELSPT